MALFTLAYISQTTSSHTSIPVNCRVVQLSAKTVSFIALGNVILHQIFQLVRLQAVRFDGLFQLKYCTSFSVTLYHLATQWLTMRKLNEWLFTSWAAITYLTTSAVSNKDIPIQWVVPRASIEHSAVIQGQQGRY